MAGTPLYLPVAKGLDQGADARIAEADRPTRLENVRFDRRGALVQRSGFSTVSNDLETAGNLDAVRGLFSTGVELCAIGDHDLYAYSDELDRWVWRGPLSPGVGRIRTVFRDERSYEESDADSLNGYAIRVARRRRRESNSTTDIYQIALGVDEVDGSRLVPVLNAGYDEANSSASWPHAVRSAHVGQDLVALWCQGTSAGGSAVTLRGIAWDTSAPVSASIPSSPVDVITSDLWAPNTGVRTYDADGDGSGMILAYIRYGSRDLRVAYHTSLLSAPLPLDIPASEHGNFVRVAVEYHAAAAKVYLLAVVDNAGIATLMVWRLNVSGLTLSVDWGPKVVYSVDDESFALTNLGITAGDSDAGASSVMMIWTEMRKVSGDQNIAMSSHIPADGTGSASAPQQRWNMVTQGRPFWHAGRAFSACTTSVATETIRKLYAQEYTANGAWAPITAGLGNIFEAEVLVRWANGNGDTSGDATWIVGAYNIGYAKALGLDIGCTNTVYRPLTGSSFRWMSTSTSRAVLALTKHMGDEVELDTTRAPIACTVERGRACIGGMLVTWYDGESTMEMGHIVPPIPSTVNEEVLNLLDGLTADDYFYAAVWYSWDASGALHRSAPSMTVRKDFTASGSPPTDSVELRVRVNPTSNRWANRDSFVIWHKAVNDIQVRLTGPIEVVPNEVSGVFETGPSYDVNQATGDTVQETLYTEGGELENVTPEGARIPVVVGGRLWFGDFMRRSRLQFSKPFAPGTGSEFAIAPETNEGFGLVLPDGEEVTGMGAIDSSLVVLTEGAIYVVEASGGPDNAGAGPQFEPRRISSDAGCIDPRSVVAYPEGILFQSKAGIYKVDRGWGVQFIGDAVRDELSAYPVVTSAVAVPEDSQVRFTVTNAEGSDGRILVYDYHVGSWVVWTPKKVGDHPIVAVAACYHQPDPRQRGTYYIAEADGTIYEEHGLGPSDPAGAALMTVQTGWVQSASHGGWQRVQNVVAMCERLSRAEITLEVETDFHPTGGSSQSFTWDDAAIQAFPRSPEAPVLMKLIDQKSAAVRVRLTGDGIKLTGFRFDVVQKRGAVKVSSGQRA